MKKPITTIAFLIVGLLTSSVMITSCNSKKTEQQEQNQETGVKTNSTTTAYACPMHPEVTGKDGDKCSKCGMKLEAVKANKDEHKH